LSSPLFTPALLSNVVFLYTVPEILSQNERDQIVRYFLDIPLSQRVKANHFNFGLAGWPPVFVKYGDSDLLAEASTQSFFHALSRGDRSTPGIPAVYNAFCGNGYYFIVMEKVDLPTLKGCDSIQDDYAVQRVASAVGWLQTVSSAPYMTLIHNIGDIVPN
jgi:hypothetical protein